MSAAIAAWPAALGWSPSAASRSVGSRDPSATPAPGLPGAPDQPPNAMVALGAVKSG